ncbi:MAG: hypothetical protein H6Q52_3039 [Deltaproteobacteria bacterium]|nr:hypothetical protein [Deltaproteobacteria bacterium]
MGIGSVNAREANVNSTKQLKIIAIGAHLDDIEIACGGTLAKALAAGHIVRMIVLSDSAYTNYDGDVIRTEEEAIKEGKEAALLLGVDDLEIHNFPSKDIPSDSVVVEFLNSRLDEFNPDLILTHWTFDTHRSHRNTALSTIAAGRYHTSILMYEPFPPGGRSWVAFRPQYYVDITAHIEKKLQSLRAHKSQYIHYGEEYWIEAVKARALFRGFDLIKREGNGTKYAESYEVLRLGIDFLG